MSDELIQAAKRLQGSSWLPGDRQKVAEAYLREHDPTPVTEEWIRIVGFKNRSLYGMQGDVFRVPIPNTPWSVEWGRNSGTLSVGRGIVAPIKDATRGNVRLLCRALGVELKEPENG